MTAIKMTPAQAKKLGLDVTTKTRTTRRTVKGEPYFTICKACGFESRTMAAEDRHLDETKHSRYELALGL